MFVTRNERDEFHRFASARLNGTSSPTWDDLLIAWESDRDREEINVAIRRGLEDVEAGRHRPAKEVMDELRRKHRIQE
jgi:hypothetical protein